MRKHLFCAILTSVIVAFSYAQNVPDAATGPATATARKLQAPFSSAPTTNYKRVFSPQVPITDSSQINMASAVESVIVATSYYDSYGRLVENVSKQTSPAKKDNVSIGSYDEFGRAVSGYLPYAASSNDGAFKLNPFQQDSAFYKSQFANEQIYYSYNLFDGSPLNIPTKSLAPGNSWGGAGKGISFGHRVSTVSDSVVFWTIAISTENDLPVKTAFYLPASLSVKEITDERNVRTLQYTNERGQLVLSKVQLSVSPGTAHVGWLCTYYVYDEVGNLRAVVSPKAVEAINNITLNWSLSATPAIYTDLCYAYFYDDRGRCIMKRIPGKGKSYTAYDLYNRVVMTQDPRLTAAGQWTFIHYDDQSRPWRSGLITTATIKDSILAQASRSKAYPTLAGTYTITSETYYDNYDWVSSSGSGLSSSVQTTDITGTNFITTYNTSPEYAQQIISGSRIRGTLTGSKKIILNTSNYLFIINFYDSRGANIQTKQTNYSGGMDVATVQYDYSGKVLRSHLAHQKSGTNSQTHKILTKYTFDHIGRLKTLVKNFDGLGDKTVAQNNYSEMGNVSSTIIGGGIETQNYHFNIRGWITGINKDHVNNTNPSAFFGETIAYDYGFTNSIINGNKSGIKWRAAGDSNVRAYGYTYDNSNRLVSANYSQQNNVGSGSWSKDKMDFSVSNLTFDANGNILTMSQRGMQITAIALIDSLNYQYSSNTNRLQKVNDLSTGGGFMGDFKDSTSAGDDYTYDVNGNINRDNNRHMHTASNGAGAVFNVLDKTDSIVIAGKATTYYYYDAGGAMVGKRVNTYTPAGKVVKNYQYLGGFVYLNDTLQYALIEGGRIRYAKKKNSVTGNIFYAYEYDYFITDHMGNVRSVVTEGRDTSTFKATMEVANQAVEDALFGNEYTPVNTIANKPSGFDSDGANAKVTKLNGAGNKTGPSLVLKVMAGDKVQLSSYAFYNTATQPPVSGVNLLNDILSVLAGGVVNNSPGKLLSTNTSAVSTALSPNVTNFLSNSRSYDNTKPKAYLNWVFFDNQFNFISGSSGVMQVLPGSSKQVLAPALQTMTKNGYLYVFVSNESGQDVYFDDITIKHITGPLMQEQAYYPYGLEIQALSDKAMMRAPTNYKYNAGSELEDEDGVGYYNTFYRKFDAQIGRFNSVDSKSELFFNQSVYSFSANNPISFNDPLGDKYTSMDKNGDKWHNTGVLQGTGNANYLYSEGNGFDGFGDLANGGGNAAPDFSGYWAVILDAFYGEGLSISNISTSIGGQQSNFGFSFTFGWGFYNGNTLTNPTNAIETDMLQTLSTFALSGNEVLSNRFFSMYLDDINHNIFTNNALIGFMPGVVLGNSGNIIGTNTFYSLTAFDDPSNHIKDNGKSFNKAQFAADFLSTTYLTSRGFTLQPHNQDVAGFFLQGQAKFVNGNNFRTLQSVQTSKFFADRSYFENMTLSAYGRQPRRYYTGLFMNARGNDFALPAGSVLPLERYGIFQFDNWHY